MDQPRSQAPTTPPVTGIRHGISPEQLGDLLAVVGQQPGEVTIAAGAVEADDDGSRYLIFTDRRMIVGAASESGLAVEATIAYPSIYRIDVERPSGRTLALSNESLPQALATHVTIRLRDGTLIAVDTTAHDFIRCAMQAIAPLVAIRQPKDHP